MCVYQSGYCGKTLLNFRTPFKSYAILVSATEISSATIRLWLVSATSSIPSLSLSVSPIPLIPLQPPHRRSVPTVVMVRVSTATHIFYELDNLRFLRFEWLREICKSLEKDRYVLKHGLETARSARRIIIFDVLLTLSPSTSFIPFDSTDLVQWYRCTYSEDNT